MFSVTKSNVLCEQVSCEYVFLIRFHDAFKYLFIFQSHLRDSMQPLAAMDIVAVPQTSSFWHELLKFKYLHTLFIIATRNGSFFLYHSFSVGKASWWERDRNVYPSSCRACTGRSQGKLSTSTFLLVESPWSFLRPAGTWQSRDSPPQWLQCSTQQSPLQTRARNASDYNLFNFNHRT